MDAGVVVPVEVVLVVVVPGVAVVLVVVVSGVAVVASVDEMDLGYTEIGQSVTLTLDRYPKEMLTGTVTASIRMMIRTQTASVYLLFDICRHLPVYQLM